MDNWQRKLLDKLPHDTKHALLHEDAHSRPTDDEALFQWVQAYLQFKIPRVAVCKNHVAPFQFIADVFFERETNVIVLANRSGGKTRDLSILNHLNSIHKPLFEIANIGAVKEQALKGFSYLKEYADKEWFNQDVVYSIMRETRYRNGSTVQVLSGTTAGVNSPHPLMLVVDETELISWRDVLMEALSMAQSKRGFKAVQILASTRKYASGNMYRLLVEKPKEPSWPYKVYPWCLWETLQKCRLSSCEQCKEIIRIKDGQPESWYDLCHDDPERHPRGKAKSSDGFYTLEDAWVKFTTLDWDIFNAQWLSLKPGRRGLVFDTFDPVVHCKEDEIAEWWERLREDRKEEPARRHLELAVVIDEGWAAPMAVLFIAKDGRDNMFLFDSIYETRLDLRDMVSMMQKRFQEYNIPLDFECRCDEKAPRVIEELNGLGLNVTAIGLPQDEQVGFIRQWLNGNYREGYPGVWIDPEKCYSLTVELETLKHRLDKEGNPRSELPDKGPDHLVNCWGYSYVDFGIAGGTLEIKVHRAEKPPNEPVKVPTRSDWANR